MRLSSARYNDHGSGKKSAARTLSAICCSCARAKTTVRKQHREGQCTVNRTPPYVLRSTVDVVRCHDLVLQSHGRIIGNEDEPFQTIIPSYETEFRNGNASDELRPLIWTDNARPNFVQKMRKSQAGPWIVIWGQGEMKEQTVNCRPTGWQQSRVCSRSLDVHPRRPSCTVNEVASSHRVLLNP